MNGFESVLSEQLELAYFVPLLAGHGGNTGGQSVGTVLSALSAQVITLKDAPRVIAKEALSGLMVGCILGSLVAPVAHYGMGISTHVAAVVGCTLPLVSTIAATLGSTIPFACVAVGLDPSVIAAPAMTSFVDVSGLMSYFLIANKIFSIFGIEL
jgi:Mg/Co/Ni transporter MgtE